MQQMKTGAERREGEFSNLSTCMGSHTCHQDEERKLKKKKKKVVSHMEYLGLWEISLWNSSILNLRNRESFSGVLKVHGLWTETLW